MNLFTSLKEKRLWILALIVQVTIYATLGVVPKFVGLIPNRDVIDFAFLFGMLLMVISTIIIGLKKSKSTIEIGLGIAIIAVYFLVFLRMNIPEERTHLIEYGIVAILLFEALKERKNNHRKIKSPAFFAIVITALLGTIDECIQYLLPNRIFDMRDVLFNILAGFMAVFSVIILNWANRRFAP